MLPGFGFDGIITFFPLLENIKGTTSTFWHLEKNKLDVKDRVPTQIEVMLCFN